MSDEQAADTTDAVVGQDSVALSEDTAAVVAVAEPEVEPGTDPEVEAVVEAVVEAGIDPEVEAVVVAGADAEAVVEIESLAYAEAVDDGASEASNPLLAADVEITPEMLRELANGPDSNPERLALLDRLLDDPALSEAYYDLLVQSLERPAREGAASHGTASGESSPTSTPTAAVQPARPVSSASVTPGGTLVVPFSTQRLTKRGPMVAIAVLALLALPLLRKSPPAPIDPMSGAGTAPATLIAPASEAALTQDIAFTWHRMRGALAYELVLLDRKGQPLQRQATTDTIVAAPGVPAETGAWTVTTTMADGTQRNSEIRTFSVSR